MEPLIKLPSIMELRNKKLLDNIVQMIEESFEDREEAYNFVCEQLDAAQRGSDIAKDFVHKTQIPFCDYNDGMKAFDTDASVILTNIIHRVGFSLEEVGYGCMYVVDSIMQKFKFGIYSKNS